MKSWLSKETCNIETMEKVASKEDKDLMGMEEETAVGGGHELLVRHFSNPGLVCPFPAAKFSAQARGGLSLALA
jgi:hypothetical protein